MQNKYFYIWLLAGVVHFGGCCTPTSKTQFLGQSPSTEWGTPSAIESKGDRPKRNFITSALTFLKRDTEEDYILVGKPIAFVNPAVNPAVNPPSRNEWAIPETAESERKNSLSYLVSQANDLSPGNIKPILQVASRAVSQKEVAPKTIASQPGDSQEIIKLIAVLNAHESVNHVKAESLLAELRKIDRSQIQPEIYQYAIHRVCSELIPAPSEPMEEIAVKPTHLPQATPPSSLQRKTPKSLDSAKLTKNASRIEIAEEKNAEERPTAPIPKTFAEDRVEQVSYDIPVGRFSEPVNGYGPRENFASLPQINPAGYSSRETFQQFEIRDSPRFASPAPKYGSPSEQDDWEQVAAFAIDALESKIQQAPNQDAAMSDQLRLQILKVTLHGGNVPVQMSRADLPGYDETVQNFVSNELFALSTLLDEKNTPEFAVRLQAAQPHFQEAQQILAKSCPLKIRNMQFIQNENPNNPQPGDFCGFGLFTPIKAEFKTNDWAWVYVEMENFVINGNETVGFNTKFSISYEILDHSGNSVLRKNLPSLEETTKSPRRDMALTIPLDLQGFLPDHYRAMIRVIDQNHIRLQMDTQRIDFIVRAGSEVSR